MKERNRFAPLSRLPFVGLALALLVVAGLALGHAFAPPTASATHKPTQPTNVRVTSAALHSLTFAWDAHPEAANGYEVQYKLTSAATWTDDTVAAGVTTYAATGLTQNTSYNFRLRTAQTSDHQPGWYSSNSFEHKTANRGPWQPKRFEVEISLASAAVPPSTPPVYQATLNWSEPYSYADGGADKYQVIASQNSPWWETPDGPWVTVAGGANARSHTFTNLTRGTSYVFWIRSCAVATPNDVCSSARGFNRGTPWGPPGPVINPQVTAEYELRRVGHNGRFWYEAVFWRLHYSVDGSDGNAIYAPAHHYEFQVRPEGSTAWTKFVRSPNHQQTVFHHVKFPNPKSIEVIEVRARGWNSQGGDPSDPWDGVGPWSAPITVSLATPYIHSASAEGDLSTATLSWSVKGASEVAKFQVSSNDGGSWTDVNDASARSHEFTGLRLLTGYTLQVRPCKADGSCGDGVRAFAFTKVDQPPGPLTSLSMGVNSCRPDFSWNITPPTVTETTGKTSYYQFQWRLKPTEEIRSPEWSNVRSDNPKFYNASGWWGVPAAIVTRQGTFGPREYSAGPFHMRVRAVNDWGASPWVETGESNHIHDCTTDVRASRVDTSAQQPAQEDVSATFSTNAITITEGQQGTYTVVLDSEPTGFVTILLTSDNADVATQPTGLNFYGGDWDQPQTVTVSTAQDADAVDDTATITHRVAGSDDVGSVTVTVTDDERMNRRASVTVTAADPVTVAEGGSAVYSVVLDGEPTGNVVIAMSSDNADVTAQPASLTFTPHNWQTAQTVTVAAAQDGDAADDAATVSHTVSGADGYAGIAVASVNVAVADDDTAGVTVSEDRLSINEGESATYTVVLDTQPVSDVGIAMFPYGVTVQPDRLTFTPDNWQTPQEVTVSAPHDDDAGDEVGGVNHGTNAAAESGYVGVLAPPVVVSVTDDDQDAQPAQAEPENNAPVAAAGPDLTVDAGDAVSLDGSGSSDPDGDDLTYAWTQTSGPGVTLAGASSATPSFTAPNADATLVFSLTVNDGEEDSAPDTASVTVVAPDPQREALEAFYNATGGGSWTSNGNWLSDQPLNQWHGVTVNGQGQVTHLQLRENNLSGSLPAALGNLEALQVLSLDRNSISGSLPTQLGNLSNLTRLAMNRNQLTGAIPSQLGSLSSLSIIGLARNSLSGTLPTSLGNLSGLTKLSLHDNTALSGALPDGFVNMANLQRLAVANTALCAPDTDAFDDWLDTVSDKPGGVETCQ